jgi:hypothetical protein
VICPFPAMLYGWKSLLQNLFQLIFYNLNKKAEFDTIIEKGEGLTTPSTFGIWKTAVAGLFSAF